MGIFALGGTKVIMKKRLDDHIHAHVCDENKKLWKLKRSDLIPLEPQLRQQEEVIVDKEIIGLYGSAKSALGQVRSLNIRLKKSWLGQNTITIMGDPGPTISKLLIRL